MKAFLFISLLSFVACGVKHTSSYDYGKAKVEELIADKGEPLEKEKIPVKDGEIYKYPDNEKYQIQNNIVTAGFKDPKGDEKVLIYWKHKFKNCMTQIIKINEMTVHSPAEYELKCSAEGLSVIYFDGSEFISRIVEHEKK
jgi:hypothetical protein